MKMFLVLIYLFNIANLIVVAQQNYSPKLAGSYLGQKPPGAVAQLFAPGIVSTQYFEHSSPVFTPDLKEIYWSTQIEENGKDVAKPILYMKQIDGVWSKPEIPLFAEKFSCCENPFITPDGMRIYFSVQNTLYPLYSEIWYANRVGDNWGEPERLEEVINHKENGAFYPTIAYDGTIYYMSLMKGSEIGYGMYVSRLKKGQFEKPIPLDTFNSFPAEFAPYIAPDQSYIIFCSFREGGYGSGDLYICFRNKDGAWGEIINMGDKINTDLNERFPNVSPDGKYFFFNSTRKIPGAKSDNPGNGQGDVYWIDARVVEELRPKD